MLQLWSIICNEKNNNSQMANFIKSTKTSSTASFSGATSLPPIGNSFMYRKTSSHINTNSAYVILERTDFIQISNLTFY